MLVCHVLCLVFLLGGLFFLLLGAIGTYALPDAYNRMHAGTKGMTLGVSGLIIAAGFYLGSLPGANITAIVAEVIVILLFQYVASPVGSHILAKGAHAAGTPMCKETIGDELAEDKKAR